MTCSRSSCEGPGCRYRLADGASCALDVAELLGPLTLDEVGRLVGPITRERTRQIELKAMAKVRRGLVALGISVDAFEEATLVSSAPAGRTRTPAGYAQKTRAELEAETVERDDLVAQVLGVLARRRAREALEHRGAEITAAESGKENDT
jgi:hypothetical protein